MHKPQAPYPDRFLRIDEVRDLTGLSIATLYRRVQGGRFPRPVQTGGAAVRWLLSEVTQWQQNCIAQRDPPHAT
jgi:prophage regulatory protein